MAKLLLVHQFAKNLITEWRRLSMPVDGATVIAAVSGGADSVSLLLALHELKERKKLDIRIVAAHFNHKLRGSESDDDENFVKKLCGDLKIELVVDRAHIDHKGNLEQNARNARYHFLNTAAERLDAAVVLTGHTINDQAETLLMNLIRGSGPDGLGGMRTVRKLGIESDRKADSEKLDERSLFPRLLCRPMLTWATRGQTEAFCHEKGVEYRYDTMNEDTAFRRVRIRKVLLPLLEDMNPNIIETLAGTAFLLQSDHSTDAKRNQIGERDELIISELKELSENELYGVLRVWLSVRRGSRRGLHLKHIAAIGRLVNSGKSGRIAEIPGGRVEKSSGRLLYRENEVEN